MLDGGHQDDFLDGGGGNDWLEGGLGDDTLYGDGADTVGGNDIIYGGDDNDSIFGGPGHDDLYGGGGDDTINGEAGCDVLDGEDGEDTIDGGDDLDSPEIIDNNESGYSEENAAMWETWTEGIEYGEDYRVHFYNQSGSNPTTATWGFGGMQGLQADVYVTWEGGDWGIEDNTYRVSGNMTGTLDTQQPDGFGQEVHDWQWAQIDVSVAGQLSYDTLTVQLEVPNEEEQPEQAGCADAAMIMPIWPELNLCTDSNNDASIDPYLGDPDDLVEERLPGRLIALQGETRAEVQLRLKVNGYDLNGCHLELTFDESMVSVWTASSGGTQLSSGATWPCSNQDVVESVYVTGLQPGRSLLTLALLGFAPQRPVPDHVGISAFGVDLDIDSNNDGYIDPDNSLLGTDDPIEDIAGQDAAPGKIILVSDEDTDGDGLVDWADGFDYWPTVAADDSSSAARFVPVELQLQGGIDLADIAIAISYSDSDPLTMEDPFIPPQHGNLRIWKKDAFQPRNPQSALAHPAGDYVASGVYTAADLGLAVGTNRLYVEAISPSTTTADQTVLVRLCPTGNSSSSTYMEDQIRITTTRIEVSAESETVAAPFDAFEFIATGLPEGITDDHCGYGPDAFQTYTIKVYDPRLGFTECLVDGTSVPLTRIDTHYESFNSFVVLEPDDAELLLADAPLEMYLKPIGSYWYGASALPDDAEAYVNPIPWAVADDLPAERVSVSDDVLSVDSTGVDGQYFVELTDAEYWNLAQDTTVEIRFRLVADDPAGNDGAWTVIVGDDTEYWEIGVLADRLVTYPGGVRTETLLPASLLTGVFHAFHFEKLATDSNATISIDGSVVTIEEGQSGSNVGLRWGDPGAGVRGHVQYDYVQWEYDNSAASETLVYEVRPSDVVGSCDAITVQSAHPTVRYNPHTVKTKASFAQIRAAATLVKETIVEVEAELQNEQWTPAAGSDVFAYGNELHRRVANKLEEYEISGGGMFRAGVGVKFSDKTITRFNATNGNQHFLATDLVWFEHGYKPRVGDALDPSRCMAFEVKTSAGKNPFSAISLQQRGRYHRVFGRGRTWAAMSKYGLHGGVMEINARWNRRMKLFGLIGLASSAYAVLTLDDGRLHAMDDQLENDIKRLRRTRNNPEANFQARVELMETIVQYLDVCTGGQSNEIMGIARRAQFYRALGETFGTNE
ncbi:MAG: hypothetical protein JXL80_07570 [Planctomycetes bacterium]|nr:hypothetical protein [Planctomycetota bacterium]